MINKETKIYVLDMKLYGISKRPEQKYAVKMTTIRDIPLHHLCATKQTFFPLITLLPELVPGSIPSLQTQLRLFQVLPTLHLALPPFSLPRLSLLL